MRISLGLVLAIGCLVLAPGDVRPEDAEKGDASPPLVSRARVRLEAGQYAAYRYDPGRGGYVELHAPRVAAIPGHPRIEHGADFPARVLRRVPAWLRDDVAAQLRRLGRAPYRLFRGGPAKVGAQDLDGDGRPELVAGDIGNEIVAYSLPDLRALELENLVPAMDALVAGPIRLDVDGDGLDDLVRVNDEGFLVWRRARGLPGAHGHLAFTREPRLFFPGRGGTAARPAAWKSFLALGDLDGGFEAWIRRPEKGWEKAVALPTRKLEGQGLRFTAPALGDLNGDGEPDVLLGHAEGLLTAFLSSEKGGSWNQRDLLGPMSPGRYASPALADLDGDGDLDCVCGNRDGTLWIWRNRGTPKEPRFEFDEFADIDVGESSSPALSDVDGDGDCDLIVGNQAGELKLFLGPDWEEAKDAFAGFDFGELAAPAIIAGDPVRIVVGNLDGDLVQLVREGKRFVERDSWRFTPHARAKTLDDLYAKQYFAEEEELLVEAQDNAANDFAMLLLAQCPDDLVDEAAFVFANTPTEVLRAMARMKQQGILVENAKAVREMAAKVDYARLVEKDDHTTIEYARENGTWVEAPRDVYYWWVVHPRILYEIPAPVDASWWDVPAKERGLTDSAWWKHEPKADVHAPSEASTFWRPAIAHDGRFGSRLFDRAARAKTLREALAAVNEFVSHGPGLMRFGYETQDVQPWLVYAKHYGSCGEHSIIGAAAARTMLIPTTVVTDRGEDHQWNEWWDVDGAWHHWDPSGASVEKPWGSTEGKEHEGKTVSSVTRWRGDDLMEETTTTVFSPDAEYTTSGRGYTDVARMTVVVEDAAGSVVDGAYVIVRSHWQKRNMVAVWGYTDGRGRVTFGLGYEPHGGYTIEVLSPLGSAGVTSFPVEEGRDATLRIRLPGEKPAWTRLVHVADGEGVLGGAIQVRALRTELRPPSPVTASRYRIGEYLTRHHGYRGTRGHPVPVVAGGLAEALVFEPEQYEKFLRGERCSYLAASPFERAGTLPVPLARPHVVVLSNLRALWMAVEVEAALGAARKPLPIGLRLGAGEATVASGGRVKITGTVTPAKGVESLRIHDPVARDGAEDVTAVLDRATGKFEVELDLGRGGPRPPGVYPVVVEATGGPEPVRRTLDVTVTPARIFLDQRIRQDEDDPLKGSPWTYGPFDLAEGHRFLLVKTRSLTEEFDCDVHLYRDRNGNGRIDGAGERIAQSTTPTADERIYVESPPAGTYWLVCQGFRVEGTSASLDVEVYPTGVPRAIVDLEPVGRVREVPEEVRFRLLPFARVESLAVALDGKDVTARCRVEGSRVTLPLAGVSEACESLRLELRVVDAAGREEARTVVLVVDVVPPVLEVLSPEAGAVVGEGKLRVEVRTADEAPGVRVTARVAGGKSRPLKPVKGSSGVLGITFDAAGWPSGEHFVWLVARDAAGNEVERVLRVMK